MYTYQDACRWFHKAVCPLPNPSILSSASIIWHKIVNDSDAHLHVVHAVYFQNTAIQRHHQMMSCFTTHQSLDTKTLSATPQVAYLWHVLYNCNGWASVYMYYYTDQQTNASDIQTYIHTYIHTYVHIFLQYSLRLAPIINNSILKIISYCIFVGNGGVGGGLE